MPNRILREGILTSERVKRRAASVSVRRMFQGMPCVICGSDFNTCIDHKTPIARGGTNEVSNLQILCEPCNLRKGARLTDDQLREWYEANRYSIDADRRHRESQRYNFDRF